MNSKLEHDEKCGKPDCDFERLNYYYGQMMVARDFRDQQQYYNEKRWMLNRFGIGWGVVHGLKVNIRHAEGERKGPADGLPFIEIEPGFALDQNGNEILLCTHQHLNVNDLLKEPHHDEDGHHDHGEHHDHKEHESEESTSELPIYIAVKYVECGSEPFRLPDTHCCDIDNDCTYSRTRETQKILASRTPWPMPEEHDIRDDHGCVIDCQKYLRNPSAKVIEDHPGRAKCQPVPLATLMCVKGRWVVDNFAIRPIAYSNYRLGELVNCLAGELGRVHATGYDRRSFVPLLAQTIPGLNYRSGRTKLQENFGELPYRITTDGRYVWCTDLQMNVVHRHPIDSSASNPNPRVDLPLGKAGWGISFDGHAMWITIPSKNAVEKINVCTFEKRTIELHTSFDEHHHHHIGYCGESEERKHEDHHPNNPREIVFDGQYLWISHGPQLQAEEEPWFEWIEHEHQVNRPEKENGKLQKPFATPPEKIARMFLTRLDPFNGSSEVVSFETKADASPIVGMVFDGRALWIAYNDAHHRAVVQRVRIAPHIPEPFSKNCFLQSDTPIELHGNGVRDITFDGNAVWATHDEGASKIDVIEYKEVTSTNDRGRMSSIVFDGRMMWMIQNRDNESELRRCDLFTLANRGGYELHEGERRFHIGRMCFDGTFLWAIGNKTDAFSSKGIIYRILP